MIINLNQKKFYATFLFLSLSISALYSSEQQQRILDFGAHHPAQITIMNHSEGPASFTVRSQLAAQMPSNLEVKITPSPGFLLLAPDGSKKRIGSFKATNTRLDDSLYYFSQIMETRVESKKTLEVPVTQPSFIQSVCFANHIQVFWAKSGDRCLVVHIGAANQVARDPLPYFPRYAQDPNGLWYAVFETELNRVKTLWSTKDNLNLAERLLRSVRFVGNVLDIGANVGTFSIPIAGKIDGKVYAFEVQKPLALQVEMSAFLNGFDVEVFNVALGNPASVSESIELPVLDYTQEYKQSHLGGFSLIKTQFETTNTVFARSATKKYRPISLKKVDDFSFEPLALIKVDVEGMDLDVLKGAVRTLERHNYPPIIFECHDRDTPEGRSLFEFLSSLGYDQFTQSQCRWDFVAQHKMREKIDLS